MKRGVLILGILGALALTLGWNTFLRAPKANERADLQEQVKSAQAEAEALQATLTRLQKLARNIEANQAEFARLGHLVPDTPDMAGFIRAMNDIAAQSQVDWASLVPSTPVPGVAGGPYSIGLSISIRGTFFQVLDYLKRLETLERLVVVDSVNLGSGGGSGGAPILAVGLEARTFAATGDPAVVPGATTAAPPAGGAPDGTTATAAPAAPLSPSAAPSAGGQ